MGDTFSGERMVGEYGLLGRHNQHSVCPTLLVRASSLFQAQLEEVYNVYAT